MGNTAFQLREEYAGTVEVERVDDDQAEPTKVEVDRYQGAVIALPPDQRSFDVKDALAKGGGLIVVDETNAALVDALAAQPELERVAAPEGADGISAYESLSATRLKEIADARGVKPDGRKKEDFVAALEAADAALAAGDAEGATGTTTDGSGTPGEEG